MLAREIVDALGRHLLIKNEAILHNLSAQYDVLSYRHHRDKHEVLMDHPNTLSDGISWLVDLHFLAIQEDLPFVRGVEAVQDVHQGGFASPILSQ